MTDEEQIEWEAFGEYAAEARACGGDVLPLCAVSDIIPYIGAACGRANYGER
tara:strand:- start:128 stop:283 length:156 start_codon:yes stop_codon:yes gene_type:complete